jgi:hypothetical protein
MYSWLPLLSYRVPDFVPVFGARLGMSHLRRMVQPWKRKYLSLWKLVGGLLGTTRLFMISFFAYNI